MQKKKHSMRWKIIGILLACWLIPFMFLIAVMGVYIGNNHSDMTAQSYQEYLAFNSRICKERLNRAVADSRQASYDGELLRVRQQYQAGELGAVLSKKKYNTYLAGKYLQNDALSCTMLWFGAEENRQTISLYNEKAGGSYAAVRQFWEKDYRAVADCAAGLGTRIGFLSEGGSLYLIRNLVDSHYETQGVLVFMLNQAYCFESMYSYPMGDSFCLWVNQEVILSDEDGKQEEWTKLGKEIGESNCRWIRGQLCVSHQLTGDSYRLNTAMRISKNVTMSPFYGYEYVMAGMVLSLFPLLAAVLYVFRHEVTYPVQALSDGARRMEEGELGLQIENRANNFEFSYLTEAFNRMSAHIREQFDRIYQEEIALREARIMALQSHINPHFMNNTMEIINWEARLAGNTKVSRMIEALSVMMDAAMDRRKRPQVSLAEEMGYVNSYLYIMKERLGRRLTVETRIPEELMSCPVPRLILQPIIENAIEHGVVPNGSGTVTLSGWQDGAYLYLEAKNDGGLSQEDRERIHRLLDVNYNTSSEPAGNLGIANVNQRLRILFGEPCGLAVFEEDKHVTARLTIPYQERICPDLGEVNKKIQEITD